MKWLSCLLCLSFSCLFGDLIEVNYDTYRIQDGSDTLYVASSQGRFLYAGVVGSKHAKCELDKKSDIFYFDIKNAPQQGSLVCGDILSANFKKGNFEQVKYKQQATTLTKITGFSTFQGSIYYELRKGISITLRPLCSNDEAIQDVLNQLYDTEFTCQNMNEQFSFVAKDSLGEDFEKSEQYEATLLDAIVYFDDKTIVINEYNYLYTGGAHGMGGQVSRIFNRQEGMIIDLTALFDPDKTDQLKELLWVKLQQIGSNNIFVQKSEFNLSDNITIDYNGISFVYQPYELLPYSYGSPYLTLSFQEAKNFITQSYELEYLFK